MKSRRRSSYYKHKAGRTISLQSYGSVSDRDCRSDLQCLVGDDVLVEIIRGDRAAADDYWRKCGSWGDRWEVPQDGPSNATSCSRKRPCHGILFASGLRKNMRFASTDYHCGLASSCDHSYRNTAHGIRSSDCNCLRSYHHSIHIRRDAGDCRCKLCRLESETCRANCHSRRLRIDGVLHSIIVIGSTRSQQRPNWIADVRCRA